MWWLAPGITVNTLGSNDKILANVMVFSLWKYGELLKCCDTNARDLTVFLEQSHWRRQRGCELERKGMKIQPTDPEYCSAVLPSTEGYFSHFLPPRNTGQENSILLVFWNIGIKLLWLSAKELWYRGIWLPREQKSASRGKQSKTS